MLTRKDEELIALLKLNARESVASLARRLGLSRTTVQDRLKRLEEQKVITGYSVKLSDETNRGGISAYVSLEVEPRRALDVTGALMAIAQIEALYTVSGKYDILALLTARSTDDIDRLLDQIGQIGGVTRTESAIVLSTKLDRGSPGDLRGDLPGVPAAYCLPQFAEVLNGRVPSITRQVN